MSVLDKLIRSPRLVETDHVELDAPPALVWHAVRHGNLARSRLVRALFALRTLPTRLVGGKAEASLRIDDLVSSFERPGFQVLAEDSGCEVAVGAIGKVWRADIPFVHVDSGDAFAAFVERGFVKVAWAIRVTPLRLNGTRLDLELRVAATDDRSWRKFRTYFLVVGPGSRFVRRSALAQLRREFGALGTHDDERALAGDELLREAGAQITHGITIAAPPQKIWPWLLQMGCRRAGFYSIDRLDNAGVRSARELHPDLLNLEVGQVVPATPKGEEGFEILRLEKPHCLVLGGLFDTEIKSQLPFNAPRPEWYWHATWAFALEPLDAERTRLRVRARAAYSSNLRWHAVSMRFAHRVMQAAQLRHLAARAEGRLPRDDYRDVVEGLSGAAIMVLDLLTPFLRRVREHWGLDLAAAARVFQGDRLVPQPRWSWTHGIEIDAPAAVVWPWIAQIGADRGGFYSYQWLENLAGCGLRNAEAVHPEWEVREDDALVLHPKAPPLRVAAVERGRYFVAWAAPNHRARDAGRPWTSASWLFMLEPLGDRKCRLISRYRTAYSSDIASRLAFGPTLVEPIGFAMDRRMLLGVKQRSEQSLRASH